MSSFNGIAVTGCVHSNTDGEPVTGRGVMRQTARTSLQSCYRVKFSLNWSDVSPVELLFNDHHLWTGA